jgi:hypothetical protein
MKPDADITEAFFKRVNMTAAEIEAWLETRESKSVGQDSGDGESIGRKSGRRIVAILGKPRGQLTGCGCCPHAPCGQLHQSPHGAASAQGRHPHALALFADELGP